MRQRILQLRKRIKEEKPLIHCITNPISIHDCANVVLAVGARPIMAEHPAEVTDITASAGALMLNLGNITDARIESMKRSMRTAMENKIPVLLDLVGVACSDLRLDLARELLSIGHPAVLKGNMSELLAVSGLPSHAIGIDAGAQDALTAENMETVRRSAGVHIQSPSTFLAKTVLPAPINVILIMFVPPACLFGFFCDRFFCSWQKS